MTLEGQKVVVFGGVALCCEVIRLEHSGHGIRYSCFQWI
jgi:hypothetical protein